MRAPVTLKIKFKSGSLEQFIERYSVDVSRGGIFIRTKEPLAVGTQLKFEFQLQDASSLISGEGTVVWIREHDPVRSGVAPGMGVRFDRLPSPSQGVLEKILAEKGKRGDAQMESRFDAGVRASASASGTVSAPAAAPANDFSDGDSKQHTPLPAPAPGMQGSGDEFGSEESTRVMQDAVVQALADKSREEEANPFAAPERTVRATQEQIDAQLRSADAQPEPTAAAAAREPKVEVAVEPSIIPVAAPLDIAASSEAPRVAIAPVPRKRSSMPVVFAAGLLLAGGGYLAFRSTGAGDYKPPEPVAVKPAEPAVVPTEPTPAAAVAPPASVVAAPAPSPAAVAPAAPAVAAKPSLSIPIVSDPPGAQVTIDGTPLPMPTPTQLSSVEPSKIYDVRVSLKGYHEWKVRLKPKAGDKLDAALVPNEKWIEVSSTPGGADVLLDGKRVGKTPFTIHKLDVSQKHEVQVKHAGFLAQTRSISATDGFEEKGDKDVLALAMKLDPEPKAGRGPVARKGPKKGDGKPEATPTEKPPEEKPAEPVAEKPATEKPEEKPVAVEKPAAEKPVVAEKPAAEKPAAEKPAAEKPAAEKPATEKPVEDKPAANEKPIKVPSWIKKQPSDAPAEGSPTPTPANP